MRHYFAPMEGLTDSIYRRLHHKYFPGVDRYYMPFISPTMHRILTGREDRELPFADTECFCAVPQLLTKVPEDFLWAAQVIKDRGYAEVNLNLGCPSGTVTAKGKGSGMLADLDALDRFLDSIFSATPLPISIKTRLGVTESAEFPALLEIYNRYPIKELTIHPRVRKQFYTGGVDLEMFRYAVENSKNPLCYNGDILSLADAENIQEKFPQVEAVMIGRGLIGRRQFCVHIEGIKSRGFGTGNIGLPVITNHEAHFRIQTIFFQQRLEESHIRLSKTKLGRNVDPVKGF